MNRREERKHSFCLIFGLSFDNTMNEPQSTTEETEEALIDIETEEETETNCLDPKEQALQWYLEGEEAKAPKKSKTFILSNINGVIQHLQEIDSTIESSLKSWTLSRLNKVDVAILRLAIYEIFHTDTPNKVVVNEAVELAKEFSSDEAPGFINGILADIIKKL
jgi:N utilization substance protein B